nr:uncharacterized protein LOC109172334 isoform X2 [Ipomoea batatas]
MCSHTSFTPAKVSDREAEGDGRGVYAVGEAKACAFVKLGTCKSPSVVCVCHVGRLQKSECMCLECGPFCNMSSDDPTIAENCRYDITYKSRRSKRQPKRKICTNRRRRRPPFAC